MKKNVTLLVVFCLLFFATACTKKTPKEGTQEKKTPTESLTEEKTQPKDCGKDLVCGNDLLAKCLPGTFSTKSKNLTVDTKITEKTASGCKLTEYLYLTELGAFAKPEFDTDKDGRLSMNCNIAVQTKNFDELTSFLQKEYKKICTGELNKYYDFLEAEFNKF